MARGPLPFVFRLTPIVVELLELSRDEASSLVRRCAMPANALDGPCTTALANVKTFMDEAAALSATPAFGLTVADAVPEGTYETAELLVRTAPTLAVGLVALARFAALINPIGRFEVRERGDRCELHYDVPGERGCLGPTMNEFTIAYLVRALRLVAEGPLALAGAWFSHGRTSRLDVVAKYFDCAVTYDTATCGVSFPEAVAARPLGSSDRVTYGFLERQATERLRAHAHGSMAAMVAEVIEKQVGLRHVDLAFVAKQLGMTERTAQRRLEEEDTSFREMLDQVRKRVAERLIATGAPASRVAEMLGFADARSLQRAVARWGTRTSS